MSRVELIGRPFLKSFRSVTLPVQYPVKLKLLQCNENVGRGEVTFLTIQIENISSKPYGSCQGSAGNVGVQVHMDARLIPIAYYGSESSDKLPHTVMYDPAKRDSLYHGYRLRYFSSSLYSVATNVSNSWGLCMLTIGTPLAIMVFHKTTARDLIIPTHGWVDTAVE